MHFHPPPYQRQKGIALFVVIVIVLMSTLFTLWASRSSLFNELVIGNDADYQRAFEAAQALVQDAEFDINGRKPNGDLCSDAPTPAAPICRNPNAGSLVWFPNQSQDIGEVLGALSETTTGCLDGICLKRSGSQDFWTDQATLDSMIAAGVAARYGQFTVTEKGTVNSKASNPILNKTAAGEGGWYWIEVMPYTEGAGNRKVVGNAESTILELNLVPMIAYRITAIARGLKPNTQVVLQSTFVRQKLKD